jgi:SNF2 family DNA or RNA helicase
MKITLERNKFVIECGFEENQLIAALPMKRFNSRSRKWAVPKVRKACEFMLEHLRRYMDEKALVVAEQVVQLKQVQYIPFPKDYKFKTKPFSHQMQALNYAYGLDRHAFFMEMGTGKTKTAIDLMSAHILAGRFDTWVVFCPNSIRFNWMHEIEIHCPLDVGVVVIQSGRKVKAPDKKLKVVIVGIESMSSKYKGGSAYDAMLDIIGGERYAVTLDESHLCKNPDANRARNIKHIASCAVVANIMTGSPVTQGLLDLYMPFDILDPDILGFGSYFAFKSRYAIMGGYENREVIGYQNQDELMDTIKPFTFQCKKEDVLDLPEKTFSVRTVSMTKEQKKFYKEIDKEMESMIHNGTESVEVFVDQVLAKYTMLQQISGGFINHDTDGGRKTSVIVQPDKNPKIMELLELVRQNVGGDVIVWAKFRREIADIVQVLKSSGIECVEYHGGLSSDEREESLKRFTSGPAKVFVANQQTGGTGLTLNNANLVIYYSNSLKLSDRMQSEDRCHRIGQDKNVLYVDIVAEGSKDAHIMNILRSKMDVAEYVRSKL